MQISLARCRRAFAWVALLSLPATLALCNDAFTGGGVIVYEQHRLAPAMTADQDLVGASVDVSGDVIVMGAPGHDGGGAQAGAVHVYRRTEGNWLEETTLVASDALPLQNLGWAVAVDGDTVVAGAPAYDGSQTSAGAAYVFQYRSGIWIEAARLTAPDAALGDHFGRAVAIQGATAFVGAPYDDDHGAESGSTYVFTRQGASWSYAAKLTATDGGPGHEFGDALAVDGTSLVVGAPYRSFAGVQTPGYAYVFTGAEGSWAMQQRLEALDGAPGDVFGRSVDIDGDTVVVGSKRDRNQADINTGSVFVFTRAGSTWTQEAKLLAVEGKSSNWFGYASAIEGDTAVVSSPREWIGATSNQRGSVSVFRRGPDGWSERQKLLASDADGDDWLGRSLALEDGLVVVGSIGNGPGGATYVFQPPAEPGVPFCFGDAPGRPCPCGNVSVGAGQSCTHSDERGLIIAGAGTASIAADDLTLTVTGLPPENTAIYYSGTQSLAPGAPLYDGLQCVGGSALRYRGLFQGFGVENIGYVIDSGFVAQDPVGGYFVAGTTYHFQLWTRDASSGPTPCGTFANLSPAYAVTMQP